jgi:hypothetical protein
MGPKDDFDKNKGKNEAGCSKDLGRIEGSNGKACRNVFFLILKHVFGFKMQRWNQTEINLNKLFGGFSILELSKLV